MNDYARRRLCGGVPRNGESEKPATNSHALKMMRALVQRIVIDNFVYTNRPLKPKGEMPAYGKMPKFEMPPFPVAGSPGFKFRSGYTSKTLSAPSVSVYRRSVYDPLTSVSVLAAYVWSSVPVVFVGVAPATVTFPYRCRRVVRPRRPR